MTFDTITRWLPTDDGFITTIPEGWMQGRAAFGGILSAGALRSLRTGKERPVRSVSTRFLAPIRAGIPLRCQTEVLREGRTLTDTRASLYQDGRLCTVVHAALGAPRSSAIQIPNRPMPQTRPPSSHRLRHIPGVTPQFLQHLDMDFVDGSGPFTGAKDAIVGGWVRFHGGCCGAEGVVGLLDTYPPPVLPLLNDVAPASTVHWTAHVIAECDGPADAWYRIRVVSETASDGWVTSRGHLWSEDGRLLGWMEQLIAVFG